MESGGVILRLLPPSQGVRVPKGGWQAHSWSIPCLAALGLGLGLERNLSFTELLSRKGLRSNPSFTERDLEGQESGGG